jgi:hypothetical protein
MGHDIGCAGLRAGGSCELLAPTVSNCNYGPGDQGDEYFRLLARPSQGLSLYATLAER